MKKILIVSNTSWSIYNFRLGLLKSLKNSGFDVVAIAPEDGFSRKVETENFKLIVIKHLVGRGTNPLKDFKLFLEFYAIYKREKPDLIIHFTIKPNIYGSISALLNRTKYINVITGLGYVFIKDSLLQVFVRFLYKIICSFSQFVVFQNDEDKNIFLKKNIVKKEKAILIEGSGVNTDFFAPDFSKNQLVKKDGVVFLMASRMLYDKGVIEFVEAARLVKQKHFDARFVLLGACDNSNSSCIPESLIKSWHEEGIINYFRETDDVRPFMNSSDVVVLPSYREGLSKVLLEAMALEKPIITTDVAGCRETTENGKNGFLVPVRDVKGLADAIMKMIEIGESERKKMGQSSREKVKNEFDEKIVIKYYQELIEKTISF
ncbi:MAG: glycosyltransferase family 4 protein [Proteobacteria bacterium]|nr:glycosyltransferase family 4 protein [Pseudomonadota bacterium]